MIMAKSIVACRFTLSVSYSRHEFFLKRGFNLCQSLFWKLFIDCNPKYGVLSETLHTDIINQWSRDFADLVAERDASLSNCIKLMEDTQILVAWSSGPCVNQKTYFTGYNRWHCVMYITATTPEGLNISIDRTWNDVVIWSCLDRMRWMRLFQ